MAPSDLPPPILVSHSMTDGIAAYAGDLEGLRWKGAGGRREVEYLILLDEIVGLGGGFSD